MVRSFDEARLRIEVKDEIRRRRRSVRAALPADARAQRSLAVCERVLGLPEWERARTVLAFSSMRTEVQCERVVQAAWAAGKRVAAPRMNETFDDLELCEWREDDVLEESGMRFLQPSAAALVVAPASIDLALVPALAVDPRGHRVGFGKGFYDRVLPRLVHAVTVAVIFDFERITEVPDEPRDQPVHIVVTDARVERVNDPPGD